MNKDNYIGQCPTCGHEILLKAKLLDKIESLWFDKTHQLIQMDEFYKQMEEYIKIWQAYKAHDPTLIEKSETL